MLSFVKRVRYALKISFLFVLEYGLYYYVLL